MDETQHVWCLFRKRPGGLRFMGCYSSALLADAALEGDMDRMATRNLIVNSIDYEVIETTLNEWRNWELE